MGKKVQGKFQSPFLLPDSSVQPLTQQGTLPTYTSVLSLSSYNTWYKILAPLTASKDERGNK